MIKRLLIICVLIFSVAAAHAQGVPGIGSVKPTSVNECSGTLVCQNFEGTGYDNSESWTESCVGATCDADYATSPAPLRGTHSLLMDAGAGNGTTYIAFTASDEISGHMMLSVGADTGGTILSIRNATTDLYNIGYNSVGNKYMANAATVGATAFTVPVTHYVWFYYKKGTGADEINRFWFSTTRTFPGGTPDIEITNGANTQQADRLYLQDSLAGPTAIFDQILVKAGTAGLENIEE